MSNSQEAAAVLAELDQFAAGFSELLKTEKVRRQAALLHEKLSILSESPALFSRLNDEEQLIVIRMAAHWLGERMMSLTAQGDSNV